MSHRPGKGAQGAQSRGSIRLDELLVSRGLAEDLAAAGALVLAGRVEVEGGPNQRRPTAGSRIPSHVQISVTPGRRYVSRGGLKLEHALGAFGLDLAGLTVLDVGASTGGFTDCALQMGAERVYAVDVGRGQLDWRLRGDPRVVSMERMNAREPFELPEKVDLAMVDVSFISLRRVLPQVIAHLKPSARALALVKPQFEAKRREVARGGVIRDPQVHALVLGRVISWVVGRRLRLRGLVASPISGESGNREFFVLLQP